MKKCITLVALLFIYGWSIIAAQTVNVTFKVDMRVQAKKGYFNPASDVVTIPGGFNNWLNPPPENTEKTMDDADGDTIYTKVIALTAGTTYEYKYNIGLGWDGKDELQGQPNRSILAPAVDTELAPVLYNNEEAPSGAPALVTFEVNMTTPARQNPNDWATRKIYVAGDFTSPLQWGDGALQMEDPDNDTVFTVTTQINSGTSIKYKFIHSLSNAGGGSWETISDRVYYVLDGEQTISKNWDDVNPNVTTGDGNIFFEVDMSVLTEFGVFNPDVDSVQIRGGFNGWNDSQPEKSLMNQDPGNPNKWFLDVPFVATELYSKHYYKYFIKKPTGVPTYANTGWEVSLDPTDSGNRDRPIIYQGLPDQEAGVQYFDGIKPDWVIPAGTTVDVNFSVDMTYATLADSQGTNPVFQPAVDSVFWLPELPLYYSVNQNTWGGNPRALVLTDPDQDMVYTGTLTITGPDFNGFLYRYGYTSTAGLIREDNSQLDMRVRFIQQTGARQFVSPYTMPQDIWSNSAGPEEAGPVVGVRETDKIALKYQLEQNYPNPFNPSTKISFSIPEAGLVSLKIYNLLGEEITTLVNSQMNKGTYEVDFDASSLSTGVYFYTIKTDNFTASKKMMLIK